MEVNGSTESLTLEAETPHKIKGRKKATTFWGAVGVFGGLFVLFSQKGLGTEVEQ